MEYEHQVVPVRIMDDEGSSEEPRLDSLDPKNKRIIKLTFTVDSISAPRTKYYM